MCVPDNASFVPGTPGSDASCWRLHTISINLAAFDGLTLENKNRLEQCRRTGAAVSLLPVGCRVSVEASDPLTTPAPTTQGDGGEGEGRVRGCCRVEGVELQGERVPWSCKWRWGANSQSDSASQSFVWCGWVGVARWGGFGWVRSHRQKPSVAPLSLSSFLSFSLLLSRSRSLAAICM